MPNLNSISINNNNSNKGGGKVDNLLKYRQELTLLGFEPVGKTGKTLGIVWGKERKSPQGDSNLGIRLIYTQGLSHIFTQIIHQLYTSFPQFIHF